MSICVFVDLFGILSSRHKNRCFVDVMQVFLISLFNCVTICYRQYGEIWNFVVLYSILIRFSASKILFW